MEESIKYFVDLSREEAKERLLVSASYFDLELPKYFNFEPILSFAYDQASKISPEDLLNWKPDRHEGLNYILMSNKDGLIAWRPFELINPLIYAKCVELITTDENWKLLIERFKNSLADVLNAVPCP